MTHGPALSRGARIFGALLCGLLAAAAGAAIARDVVELGVHDLVWAWFGIAGPLAPIGRVTSLADGQLFAVYLAGLFAVWRTPAAAAFFASVGALTVALRSVILWTLLTGDFTGDVWDFTTGRWAVVTLAAGVGLGLLLLVTVAAGRQPSGQGYDHGHLGHGYGSPLAPAVPAGDGPAPPRPANGLLAFFLLGIAAMAAAAWQVYWFTEYGGDVYKNLVTGERSVSALTQPPTAVYGWSLCVLLTIAAFAALAQAPLSRPVGMLAGWLMLVTGVAKLVLYVEHERLFEFDAAPTASVLDQVDALYQLAAGLLLLLLLAPRGVRAPALPPWQGERSRVTGYGGYAPPPSGRGV